MSAAIKMIREWAETKNKICMFNTIINCNLTIKVSNGVTPTITIINIMQIGQWF